MMQKIITLSWVVLGIAFFLLEGCAPVKPYVLDGLQRDPQFTMIEVLATGLVLGGVTVSAFPVDEEQRPALTQQLEQVLTKYSIYRVNTQVKLSERLDAQKYNEVLNYFGTHFTLPEQDFKQISGLYTPARYILFVNVDSEAVKKYTEDRPDVVAYISARIMSARMYIFNIETGALTLFTGITVRDAAANQVQKLGGGGNIGLILGNIITQATFGGFPEVPDRQHTLYKLFYAVADQIPKN